MALRFGDDRLCMDPRKERPVKSRKSKLSRSSNRSKQTNRPACDPIPAPPESLDFPSAGSTTAPPETLDPAGQSRAQSPGWAACEPPASVHRVGIAPVSRRSRPERSGEVQPKSGARAPETDRAGATCSAHDSVFGSESNLKRFGDLYLISGIDLGGSDGAR